MGEVINMPKIVIQKRGGRLREGSIALLNSMAGGSLNDRLDVQNFRLEDPYSYEMSPQTRVSCQYNMPVQLFPMRDDDIPNLVANNACQFGIVGSNVVAEWQLANARSVNNGICAQWKSTAQDMTTRRSIDILAPLNFGTTKLMLAIPQEIAATLKNDADESWIKFIAGARIATSYPYILEEFLTAKGVEPGEIISLQGNVEASYPLGLADAVCDLVESGRTLRENALYLQSALKLMGIRTNKLIAVKSELWDPK